MTESEAMKGPQLMGWTKTYCQDADDSTPNDQELVIEQQDAGAGAYWIIKTAHWAFNDLDDLIEFLTAAGVERREVK